MEKPTNTTVLNACIIPPRIVSESYVSISRSLQSDGTMFILGGDRFAHMTAYMARFADSAIPEVVAHIGTALEHIKPFYCQHTGYLLTEGRYLEASYRKSDDFMSLHETLITHLKDLRFSPGQPHEEGYFAPYTPEQRKNAAETGYDLARILYRPHVTLTRYFDGNVPHVFPALPEAQLSFEASTLCLYKADDNGAVFELVKEYWLRT